MGLLSRAMKYLLTDDNTLLRVGSVSDGGALIRDGSGVTSTPVTAVAKTLLDDSTVLAMRGTLGVKATWVKTAAPTSADDSSSGYSVGDLWNDTSNQRTYIADDVSPGAPVWRSLLTANTVAIEVVDDAVVAYGGTVTNDGLFVATVGPIEMTAEGTDYGEVISDGTITVPGPVPGDTGSVQANSCRFAVALADLGIVLSGTNPRQANIRILCDSITDNAEAPRSGTVALCAWLGVGSTTAIDITGIQRPSSGTGTYQEVRARTSATSLTGGTASALNFGSSLAHEFPSNDGTLFFGALTQTGGLRATGAQSGGAISSSNPTHLVLALRASASATGAAFVRPRVTITFGPSMADF